jgi:internalin A
MPKDAAYLEAEKKIQEALKSSATKLELGGDYKTKDEEKLTELPESLWELKQLKSLKISYTKLTTLPDSLAQLTQLTSLNLSRNKLTTLPESLGRLTQLTELDISDNQLTALPDSIGQLTQLTSLDLSRNKLTALPDSIAQLTQLTSLDLSYNQLTTLPESIGQLTQLTSLNLSNNKLTALPESIRQLTNLKILYLQYCAFDNQILPHRIQNLTQLEVLGLSDTQVVFPSWIEKLTKLRSLYFCRNKLTDIPPPHAQLEHLKTLDLGGNPLNPALQSAYDACKKHSGYEGYEPLWAYLRSIETDAEPLYEAKLVLVGEGDVGKTTLLKALKGDAGDAPKAGESTTHGIDIHKMNLPHPEKEAVNIQLNAWDFGGQNVYRVTHQFFFSRRSLYILVWEPRGGVAKGQVEDWLNMIRLRVGADARVIIVSTHAKTGERIARIDQPVFLRDYPEMIAGFYEVDSLVPDPATGEMHGIAALKEKIAAEAAQLEQMGMLFNNNWKAARDELVESADPRISYTKFAEVCAKHTLSEIDTSTLASLMHDLGYIVHYGEDENLRNDVVLKPQWLTKAIGFVLEDRATQDADGILPDERLFEVWHDHQFKDEPRYTPDLYPFFLRLMEKYDVSYRLPNGDASLVAQHVPQIRPQLPWLPEDGIPEHLRRIAMICALDEDPPGLMPWMIVRTHDYAVDAKNDGDDCNHRLHWQKGIFLRYDPHGEAFVEKRGRELHVYAQADWPQYFMTVLQDTLKKLIKDNWPGMEGRYRFTIPCPTVKDDGDHCKGRFNVKALQEFMTKSPLFPCQECFEMHSISDLLMGFEERSLDEQLRRLQQEMRERFDGLDSRIASYFMSTMRAIADEAKYGPRLFTLRSDPKYSPKELFIKPMQIQLWCEAEGCQHPVIGEGKGLYELPQPREWVAKIAPYANFALKVLNTVAPLAAPAINTFFGTDTTKAWKIDDQLKLTNAVLKQLPEKIKGTEHSEFKGGLLSEPERSGILALHQLIRAQDPAHSKLGLHRVATYTGDYRWLCKHHYDDWQPNIPDVIEGKKN